MLTIVNLVRSALPRWFEISRSGSILQVPLPFFLAVARHSSRRLLPADTAVAAMAPPPASCPPTPTATAASTSRIDSPFLKAALAMALIHYNRLPGKTAAAATSARLSTTGSARYHWTNRTSAPLKPYLPHSSFAPFLPHRPRTGSARFSASARSSSSSKVRSCDSIRLDCSIDFLTLRFV
jgi:hypothetical protein